jgi:DNA-binding transcriptional MerR regulator
METGMSLKQVARLLGIKAYRVQYAIAHENVPEPRLRFAGRRVFEAEDVKRLAVHFHVAQPAEPAAEAASV